MKVFPLLCSGFLSGVLGSTCVQDTTQCGGKGWTGLTKCCSSGSVCTYRNEYYSKCMPKTGPTPTPSSCSNKTDSQCGGLNFKGNTCCPTGLKCTYRNEWFSKCMVSSGPTPTPSSCSNKTDSQCGGLNFKGNTCCPTGLKCTYRNEWFSKCMASSPTPTPSSCSNKTDSQCGGLNFKGNTCCPTGLKCTYRNEWFSKCMTPSSPTPAPTKGTTSKPVAPTPSTSKPTTSAPTDVCTPNPCQQSAKCSDLYYGASYDNGHDIFVCDCPAGYTGDKCQTKCGTGETPCGEYSGGFGGNFYKPNDVCCASNAECFDLKGKYDVSSVCGLKTQPTTCSPSPCVNGGVCKNGSDYDSTSTLKYCDCSNTGYSGQTCQTKVTPLVCTTDAQVCWSAVPNPFLGESGKPGDYCCAAGEVCSCNPDTCGCYPGGRA